MWEKIKRRVLLKAEIINLSDHIILKQISLSRSLVFHKWKIISRNSWYSRTEKTTTLQRIFLTISNFTKGRVNNSQKGENNRINQRISPVERYISKSRDLGMNLSRLYLMIIWEGKITLLNRSIRSGFFWKLLIIAQEEGKKKREALCKISKANFPLLRRKKFRKRKGVMILISRSRNTRCLIHNQLRKKHSSRTLECRP